MRAMVEPEPWLAFKVTAAVFLAHLQMLLAESPSADGAPHAHRTA
jgi:hypothetical protein